MSAQSAHDGGTPVAGSGPGAGRADSPSALRARGLGSVHAVVLAGVLAIALAAVIALAQSEQRRAGTNFTEDLGYVISVPAGQSVCEPGELVPADTAALKVDASAPAGAATPPLAASVSAAGVSASGTLAGGWKRGWVQIPVTRIRDTAGGTVCIRNAGSVPVAFGGSVPDGAFLVSIDGHSLGGRLRIEYLRPGRESWFQLLPTLAHRFSLAKSGLVRHWAAIAVLVLMLCAAGLAVRTLLVQEREPTA